MLPFILISLIPAISVFSIWARSTMSAPIVALLYVSYTVWLLFRAFLSFLMFHDSLAHWFWNFVSSIFVLFYIQLLPELDVCFMCQFGWIWALSSFSILVRIHKVNLLGIYKFCWTFILKGVLHLSFLIKCYHFIKILLQFIKLL